MWALLLGHPLANTLQTAGRTFVRLLDGNLLLASAHSEIDRLGDRLRRGAVSAEDVRLLNTYRLSFWPAYSAVSHALLHALNLHATGRPAKSTRSIADKLRHEEMRLTRMQDIAGCRLIVDDVGAQDDIVHRLTSLFADTTVLDQREKAIHGYRAVHVILGHFGAPVEVQVRTTLEHEWAELSEKLSDVVDRNLKYGSGPETVRSMLRDASSLVLELETLEREVLTLQGSRKGTEALPRIRERLAGSKRRYIAHLQEVRQRAESWKRRDVVSH
jgi:ppGpp synthetase/RelA/SpoT-type nucleotidyltranferase